MSSPTLSLSYRPDIDGLRGVAVLLVVRFHAHITFRGGFVGVDVFRGISDRLILDTILAAYLKVSADKAAAAELDPAAHLFDSAGLTLIEENGISLYGGGDHLTIAGALRLKPLFSPVFSSSAP